MAANQNPYLDPASRLKMIHQLQKRQSFLYPQHVDTIDWLIRRRTFALDMSQYLSLLEALVFSDTTTFTSRKTFQKSEQIFSRLVTFLSNDKVSDDVTLS